MRRRGESRMLPPRGGGVPRQRGEHAAAAVPAAVPERHGSVTLVHDRGRDWLAFAYPFDEALNEEIKRLPGRRFDWDDRRWLVPADRRLGSVVLELLARNRWLAVADEVRAWIETFSGWSAVATATEGPDGPVFAVATLGGAIPEALRERAAERDSHLLLPLDAAGAELLEGLDGVELDERAARCAALVRRGETA